MFVTKMFDVTCTAVQRLAYNIRDVVLKNDVPIAQISKVVIDMLLEIIDIMDRVCIIILFCNYISNYCEQTVCSYI